MMSSWDRNQGDLGSTLTVQLLMASPNGEDPNPIPANLTAVTAVKGFVYNPSKKHQPRIELDADVWLPEDGLVIVQLNPWLNDAAAGVWSIRYRCFSGLLSPTWPDGKADRIRVWT